jgi:hypothetical protein
VPAGCDNGVCFDAAIAGYVNNYNPNLFGTGAYFEGNAIGTGYATGINTEASNCYNHVSCGSSGGNDAQLVQSGEFDLITTSLTGNAAPTHDYYGIVIDMNSLGAPPSSLSGVVLSTIAGSNPWGSGFSCNPGAVGTGSCFYLGASSSADNSPSALLSFESISSAGVFGVNWIGQSANFDIIEQNNASGAQFTSLGGCTAGNVPCGQFPQFEMTTSYDNFEPFGLVIGNFSGDAAGVAVLQLELSTPNFDAEFAIDKTDSNLVIQSDTAITNGIVIKSLAGGIALEGASGALTFASLPSSGGSGGLYACVDSSGNVYRKSACP